MKVVNMSESPSAFKVFQNPIHTVPLVADSPHSCNSYPSDFRPVARKEELLTSWDAYIDELFISVAEFGGSLVAAQFPRFYIDVNRARDDIDPEICSDALPFTPNPSRKSKMGMGLIRRFALPDIPVYSKPLTWKEILDRIETYYDPYVNFLSSLIQETHQLFDKVVHLNCHSMKSCGNAMNDDPGALRPDIVVSNSDNQTSDQKLAVFIAELFRKQGLETQINNPYKGGELIKKFSNQEQNQHSIQIEINRKLYMNEVTFSKKVPEFKVLQSKIGRVISDLVNEL